MVKCLAVGVVSAALMCSAPAQVVAAASGDTDKRAKRGLFDETTQVKCAQERGQALTTCEARVARGPCGATVKVTFANGFARFLTFEGDAFVRANTTMSGTGRDIDWALDRGTFVIRVDDQRFELPVVFVIGE